MTPLPIVTILLKNYSQNDQNLQVQKFLLNRVLLDTGTSDNLIDYSVLSASPFTPVSLSSSLNISNALKQVSSKVISSYISLNIYFPDHKIELVNRTFYVVKGLSYNAIIGMSVLNNLKINFKLPLTISTNNFLISQNVTDVIFCNNLVTDVRKNINCLSVVESMFLNPGDQRYIKFKFSRKIENQVFLDCAEWLLRSNCVLQSTIVPQRNIISLQNRSQNVIKLTRGDHLGSVRPPYPGETFFHEKMNIICNQLCTYNSMSDFDKQIHDRELNEWKNRRAELARKIPITGEIAGVIKNLPDKIQPGLKKLLRDFHLIFARSKHDSGLSKKYLVDLTLKNEADNTPIFRRPYKTDSTTAAALELKINELEKAGILEICSSPWNSPVMVIKKKDNSFRIVNNYATGLNDKLLQSHFPTLPMRSLFQRISACIDDLRKKYLGEKIIFSNVDIRNGYYSLSIKASTRKYTAFLISDKQLQYARLSQGLSLAPGDFQQFMHSSFQDISDPSWMLQNYLDDFCIISTESNHMAALKSFFEQCRKKNIVLELQKCRFFVTEMQFLGFLVSEHGFKTEPCRIQTLLNLEFPETAKAGMRTMGMLNFFSRSIPRISFYLHPLATEIAKKDRYKLNSNIRMGINKVKDYIKSGLVTKHLSYSNQSNISIFLAVDTSLYATGFALGNAVIDNEKITDISFSHFGSKIFDPVVSLMSSRSRELIGLQLALESFSDLLPSTLQFTAIVDHESLTRVFSSVTLGKTSHMTRVRNAYATVLNYQHMTIRHLPGKSALMSMVDGISRSYLPIIKLPMDVFNPNLVMSNNFRLEIPTISFQRIQKEQNLDPEIHILLEKMRGSPTGSLQVKSKCMFYRTMPYIYELMTV